MLPVDETALSLARLAVTALVDEAELTPKPALVDRRGSGAHRDLDLARMRSSARALYDGFVAIARTAAAPCPRLLLREELARIGRGMERRMLAATGGSNAHRGAIWALGLLVGAAARRIGRRLPLTPQKTAIEAAAIARLPDLWAEPSKSNGDRARARFGATGARGEAQAGFPHALLFGLPALRAARGRGLAESHARLDALMAIMANLDDTCLLHRGGAPVLARAKAGACAVILAGGASTGAGLARLERLHVELMDAWASPGGSGDLLAVTLFLDRLARDHALRRRSLHPGDVSWRY